MSPDENGRLDALIASLWGHLSGEPPIPAQMRRWAENCSRPCGWLVCLSPAPFQPAGNQRAAPAETVVVWFLCSQNVNGGPLERKTQISQAERGVK